MSQGDKTNPDYKRYTQVDILGGGYREGKKSDAELYRFSYDVLPESDYLKGIKQTILDQLSKAHTEDREFRDRITNNPDDFALYSFCSDTVSPDDQTH